MLPTVTTETKLQIGHATEPGAQSRKNDDAYLIFPAYYTPDIQSPTSVPIRVAIVADGLGEDGVGGVASQLAVEKIYSVISELQATPIAERMVEAFHRANADVFRGATEDSSLIGMRTSVAAAAIIQDILYVSHTGNTRVYISRENSCWQLTTDDTWTNEAVHANKLSIEDAATHPKRNVVTRSLGAESTIRVNQQLNEQSINGVLDPRSVPTSEHFRLRDGDTILLCTKGIWSVLTDDEIHSVISQNPPEEAANRLTNLVTGRDGADDATVVTIRWSGGSRASAPTAAAAPKKSSVAGLAIAMVLLLLLGATWWILSSNIVENPDISDLLATATSVNSSVPLADASPTVFGADKADEDSSNIAQNPTMDATGPTVTEGPQTSLIGASLTGTAEAALGTIEPTAVPATEEETATETPTADIVPTSEAEPTTDSEEGVPTADVPPVQQTADAVRNAVFVTLTSRAGGQSSSQGTPTVQAIPVETNTATVTATPTPTETPDLEATEQARSNSVATSLAATLTAMPTATLTATPSPTATALPTNTDVPTPDVAATATQLANEIATSIAATLTALPTNTPQATATQTPVPTNTSSPTAVPPTNTPVPTVDLQATSEAIANGLATSVAATLTAIPTQVPTRTAVAAASSSNSTPPQRATAAPTDDIAATETADANRFATSVAATLTAIPTNTAQPTATATRTPTKTPIPTRTPTPTEIPNITATSLAQANAVSTSIAATLTSLPTNTAAPTLTATQTKVATSTPSATPDAAASVTALAQAFETSVAATLTALPTNTPNQTATREAEVEQASTRIAATLTARPTSTSTDIPTSIATATPAITATATSPSVPQGGILLTSPGPGVNVQDRTRFEWTASFPLQSGLGLEVVFWRPGQDPLLNGFGLAAPSTTGGVDVNLGALDSNPSHPLEPGEYLWGVILVRTEPYERIQAFGEGRTISYNRSGGGSGSSGTGGGTGGGDTSGE